MKPMLPVIPLAQADGPVLRVSVILHGAPALHAPVIPHDAVTLLASAIRPVAVALLVLEKCHEYPPEMFTSNSHIGGPATDCLC